MARPYTHAELPSLNGAAASRRSFADDARWFVSSFMAMASPFSKLPAARSVSAAFVLALDPSNDGVNNVDRNRASSLLEDVRETNLHDLWPHAADHPPPTLEGVVFAGAKMAVANSSDGPATGTTGTGSSKAKAKKKKTTGPTSTNGGGGGRGPQFTANEFLLVAKAYMSDQCSKDRKRGTDKTKSDFWNQVTVVYHQLKKAHETAVNKKKSAGKFFTGVDPLNVLFAHLFISIMLRLTTHSFCNSIVRLLHVLTCRWR